MPEHSELQRKTGQRALLIASYKRLKKKTDRTITSVAEAVRVPAHFVPPGSLQAKQLCHLDAHSHWGRAATEKGLASMHAESLQLCPTLCDPVDCGLKGFSVRERGSPGKNTGAYWPILVAIPF